MNLLHLDIMLDLETLGTAPSSPVIAIGATGGAGTGDGLSKFYAKIPLTETAGELSKETVLWWLGREKEAIDETFNNGTTHRTLPDMLHSFTSWFNAVTSDILNNPIPYTIWGNAASFDLVLLRETYKSAGLKVPWNFRNEGCYRTLKNLYPAITFNPTGVKHCALDDAINQHEHLGRLLHHMGAQR